MNRILYPKTVITAACAVVFFLLSGCSIDQNDFLEPAGGSKNLPGDSRYSSDFAKMEKIQQQCAVLWPLQKKLPPARVGDWLYFNHERPQSTREYIRNRPVTVTTERPVLYLRKTGEFTAKQKRILPVIKEFLEMYFQCAVKWQQPVALKRIAPQGLASDHKTGVLSLSSIYLTDYILKPELPSNGWGVLGITGNKIHKNGTSGEQYGDALIYGRAAVISLYHFDKGRKDRLLERSLKGASHEAGHMLSIPHCTRFYCNMNGRVGLEQFDRCPLYLCPSCLAKLLYATSASLQQRISAIADFSQKYQLSDKDYFENALQIMNHPAPLQ